jgi:hypothetical protein
MANEDQNWTKALDELRNAPAKEGRNASLRTKISASIDDILAFRSKGYSDSDILEILKRNGVVTTIGTLRHYIGVAKRTQKEASVPRRTTARKSAIAKDVRKAGEGVASAQSSGDSNGGVAPTEDASNRHSGTISSEAPKPAQQRGKTAAEVLGHRLDDSEL